MATRRKLDGIFLRGASDCTQSEDIMSAAVKTNPIGQRTLSRWSELPDMKR